MIKFIKSGFNTNCGYSILKRTYNYLGVTHIGYMLIKNYTFFWIPGYDRIEVFIDKKQLQEYLELNSIKLN
jgi:hypothetical protein